MKKYKLIKEYPGSPNLNSVAEFDSFKNDYCVGKQIIIGVKNNPEFWQLIKQAPKIGTKVEIKGTVNGCYGMEGKIGIVTNEVGGNGLLDETDYVGDLEAFNIKVNDNWIGRVACTDWQEVVELDYEILIAVETESKNLEIKSILRKSDNEVFSVGDCVHLNNGNGYRNPIIRLEIKNQSWGLKEDRNRDVVYVFLKTICNEEWGPIKLDHLLHSDPLLFRTRDGVDLFKNDKYFQISNKFELAECKAYDENNFCESLIIFSSKKAAQSYIDENKPKYSEKDMLDFGKYITIKFDHKKMDNFLNNWKSTNGKN